MLFEHMITNILVTYPTQTSLVSGALMRARDWIGKERAAPSPPSAHGTCIGFPSPFFNVKWEEGGGGLAR
eukprot:COSAG05_NODE_1467_length_4795_cov_1.624574_2_plen_70_part_00